MRLASDELDLGVVPLRSDIAGSYTAEVAPPSAGSWRIEVSFQTSQYRNPVTTLQFTVDE